MQKTILSAIILTAIAAMMIPTIPIALADKKEIDCDDCTLRFQGKNEVVIKFGGAGAGGAGPQGEQGLQGEKGDQGEQGLQGEKGDKGDTGETGPQGEAGISGVSGTNGTVLDNQTVDNLQYFNENIDTIKALVDAWNAGTLGVPVEVTNETGNVTEPVDNQTTPEVPVENVTEPLPPIDTNVTLPENVTGQLPINVTGNITVPNGNFTGDVNVTLPDGNNSQTENVTFPNLLYGLTHLLGKE